MTRQEKIEELRKRPLTPETLVELRDLGVWVDPIPDFWEKEPKK